MSVPVHHTTRRSRGVHRLRRVVSATLVAALLALSVPFSAPASIYELPEPAVVSPTNPGQIDDYSVTWREGWGNDLLPKFLVNIPVAVGEDGEYSIVGAYYYLTRPGSMNDGFGGSVPPTMHAGLWPDCYYAVVADPSVWNLYVDVAAEMVNPGPLFDYNILPPIVPGATRNYEGPYELWYQFVASQTTSAAVGAFDFGVDVTPPAKVTQLVAKRGLETSALAPTDWLTQSRVVLSWEDKLYDTLSGAGYFEIFLDGEPFPLPDNPSVSQKVYDLQEHYSPFILDVETTRSATIEKLPAGTHTLQVRCVDRATNAGPLSDPVTINVDPDFPTIEITSPDVDGEKMGAAPSFSADVTDEGGVQYVRFLLDGNPIATDTAAPYTAVGNLAAAADGSAHTLRVEAVDMAGRTNYTQKTFVVDKKPTAQIVTPVATKGYSSLVPVKVAVQDKTEILNVKYRWEGVAYSTYFPAAGTTSTVVTALMPLTGPPAAAPGPHTLTIQVNGKYASLTTTRTFTFDSTLRPTLSEFQGATNGSVNFTSEWFNTAFPTFRAIDVDEISNPSEILYAVDRNPMRVIDTTKPWEYASSPRIDEGTTLFTGVIDLMGVYLNDVTNLNGSKQYPVSNPLEGIWYTHSVLRNAQGQTGPQNHTVFGVDLTPPSRLATPTVYSSPTSATPVTDWMSQSSAYIRWSGAQADALSGVHHFLVYIDGEVVENPVAFEQGRPTMNMAIENLDPGPHTVEVTAVDRAGNESLKSGAATIKIKSSPVITITSPASAGTTLTSPTPLRATVTDVSGVTAVTMSLNTTTTTVTKSAGGALSFDFETYLALPTGTHTVTFSATSTSGPAISKSVTFNVDESLDVDTGGGGGGGGGPEVVAMQYYNTPFPTFTAKPSSVPTDPTELLYLVDRTATVTINPATPDLYYSSFRADASTTYFNGLIDQWGVYLSNPGQFDADLALGPTQGLTSLPLPSGHMEGLWYLHALMRNADGDGSPVTHVPYIVDLTQPLKVTGVGAYRDLTTPVSGWLDQSRVIIKWDNGWMDGAVRKDWDKLSHTHHYNVYVDGVRVGGDDELIMASSPSARARMALTIEDLTQGEHVIHVTAVDKAGNEGPLSDPVYVRNDIEDPQVTITSPQTAGQLVGAYPVFSAEAADENTVTAVGFYVGATLIATDTSAPYEITADLSGAGYADGASYTLTARAVDVAGRAGTASRTFVLDKKPRITMLSPSIANQAFSSLVPIKALVTDRVGIDRIEVRLDANPAPIEVYDPAAAPLADAFSTLEWVAPGPHTVWVRAISTSGVSSDSSGTINVGVAARPDLAGFDTAVLEGTGDVGTHSQWFNTAFPTFTPMESNPASSPVELLYFVDRTAESEFDPDTYYSSYDLSGGKTLNTGIIDQVGIYLSNPAAFSGISQAPSMVNPLFPYEGIWYQHAIVRNGDGTMSPMSHVAYGLDLTPPTPVASIAAYSSSTSVTPIPDTLWLDQTRAVIRWSGLQTDALSGTEYFKVYVDGVALDDTVPFQRNVATMSMTIEDFAPGPHEIRVSAVDRAGNESDKSAPTYVKIKSTPVITITSPASAGTTLTSPTPLRATVTDVSGVTAVTMSVNTTSTTVTKNAGGSKTYYFEAYLALPTGTHTVTFAATSTSGPATSKSVTFNVDESLGIDTGGGGGGGGGGPEVVAMQYYNTPFPEFTAQPSSVPTDPTELLYLVDRTATVTIDPATPDLYYSSFRTDASTTYFNGLIDQWGVYLSNPLQFDADLASGPTQGLTSLPLPSGHMEGLWYLHALMRNADGDGSPVTHVPYIVDLTQPLKVTGVGAYRDLTTPVSGWLDQSRVIIKWDNGWMDGAVRKDWDKLSHTHHYNVYVDGVRVGGDDELIMASSPSARARMALTIEDLTQGEHVIHVTAVDKAGNEGPLSDPVYVRNDIEDPQVTITSPQTAGQLVGAYPVFSAEAADENTVTAVGFYVGATLIATDTSAPYEITADLSGAGYADGATYTLTARAVDVAGRAGTASRTFVLDKKPKVVFVSPSAPGQYFSNLVPIKAQVTDRVGIDRIEVRLDANPVPVEVYDPAAAPLADAFSTVEWITGDGLHTVRIRAVSSAGVVTDVSRTINVSSALRPDLAAFDTAVIEGTGDTGGHSTWFNTLFPTFTPIQSNPASNPVEMVYFVDRSPETAFDPSTYYSSYDLSGGKTLNTGIIDQVGVYLSNPAAFNGTTLAPTMVNAAFPVEGLWYQHALVRNEDGSMSPMSHVAYGIDLTAPAAVSGVAAYSSSTSMTPIPDTLWLNQNRVVLRWNGSQIDALSGVNFYEVFVDGVKLSNTVPFQVGRTSMSMTIEDLAAGQHSITMRAVDKAGNVGQLSTPVIVKIQSAPTITISFPASVGATLTNPAQLMALVSDSNGISNITMTISGTALSRTFSPAGAKQYTALWSQILTTGSYTLNVSATSVSGPISYASRSFYLDTTLLPPSGGTGGGDPGGGGSDPGVQVEAQWFNTPYPTFLCQPSNLPTEPLELLYAVDRSPLTVVNASAPQDYYSSYDLTGLTTYFKGVIDQWGVLYSDPVNLNGNAIWPERVNDAFPIEGTWYIHALVRDANGTDMPTTHTEYGVDLTAPLAVSSVHVYPSITAATPCDGPIADTASWIAQNRVVVKWDNVDDADPFGITDWDKLSGTDHYNVYVDGRLVVDPEESEDLISYQPTRTVDMAITIEDLTEGWHKIEVSAVDKAGNEGPRRATTMGVDFSSPKAFITSPSYTGQKLGLSSVVSALATDNVGVKAVEFRIDGTSIGTLYPTGVLKSYNASIKPNWPVYTTGTHTLTVVVSDFNGHSVASSRTFYLDKTPPVISYVSGAPTPFYPRIREGYKDNFYVRFRASESCTARVDIRNSSGTIIRTLYKTVPAGSNYVIWNGKDKTGAVKAGTYKWTVRLTDPAKNVSKAVSGYTSIRFYEVVRVNASTVRIIKR